MPLDDDRKALKQGDRTDQDQGVVLLTDFLNANGDPVKQGVSLRQWFILAILESVCKVLGPAILGKLVALADQASFILLHVVTKSIKQGHDNIQSRTAERQGNTDDRDESIGGPPCRKTPREPHSSSDCPPSLIPIDLSIPRDNSLLQKPTQRLQPSELTKVPGMLEANPHVSGLDISWSSFLDRAQELASWSGIQDLSSATLSLGDRKPLVLIPTTGLRFKLRPILGVLMRKVTLEIHIKLTGPVRRPRERGRDKPRRHLD